MDNSVGFGSGRRDSTGSLLRLLSLFHSIINALRSLSA